MNEYQDIVYMRKAIELAYKGIGLVNPNPMVGVIIVADGEIIGEGYHMQYGKPHAEVIAIQSVTKANKNRIEGSTLYVTLEPCSHHGKTPPCTDLLLEKKVARVVVGMLDPNPLVSGKGIEKLQHAGVNVEVGILKGLCEKLNEKFLKFITRKTPFVLLKAAMSLDGKIATYTGDSKWISSEASRQDVQRLRKEYMAIMVGINTVIQDNPYLTCRTENGINPIKIIIDSRLRIPLDAKVLKKNESKSSHQRIINVEGKNYGTIIFTTNACDKNKKKTLKDKDILVIEVSNINRKVNLRKVMQQLGELGIDSLLLEGGGTLNFSAISDGIVDKIKYYIAPKIIGGKTAISPIEGNGFATMKEVIQLKERSIETIDNDIIIEGYL